MAEKKEEKAPVVEKKKVSGGKKPHKNKPTSKKYTKYTVHGDKVTRAPHCPRCGAGVFLASRNGRMHCGKCSYTEFSKK